MAVDWRLDAHSRKIPLNPVGDPDPKVKIGAAMSTQAKPMQKPPGGYRRLISVTTILIVVTGLLSACIYLFVGTQIIGKEFSPQTFQVRTFTYRRLPGTTFRLSATKLTNPASLVDKPVLQHLTAPTSNPRWDIIDVSEGAAFEERPPAILYKLLEARGANSDRHWNEWSAAHPELAKVFWPIIQKQALEKRYPIVPELCDIAMDSESAESLQTRCTEAIDNYLKNMRIDSNSQAP